MLSDETGYLGAPSCFEQLGQLSVFAVHDTSRSECILSGLWFMISRLCLAIQLFAFPEVVCIPFFQVRETQLLGEKAPRV